MSRMKDKGDAKGDHTKHRIEDHQQLAHTATKAIRFPSNLIFTLAVSSRSPVFTTVTDSSPAQRL